MNEETKTKNEQQQTNTQPAENGDPVGGKTFTQDEVNNIVRDRLAREKEKLSEHSADTEREKSIEARENALTCREYIQEKGLPKELLDILDTSDAEKFKAAAQKAQAAFAASSPHAGFRIGADFSQDGAHRQPTHDPIADAFKPKG